MTRYLVRRLLQSVLLLVVVSIIGFAVLNLAPGGPLAAYALNPGMTQADRDRLAHQLGLDQPLPVQYGRWVSGLLVGDWGRSFRDSRPVLTSIAERVLYSGAMSGCTIEAVPSKARTSPQASR